MFGKKSRCKIETSGVITDAKCNGMDCPTVLTIEYEVDGTVYFVKESAKIYLKAIKIGFLPIGARSLYRLGDISIGNTVRVLYNQNKPGESYLPDNKGILNA